MKIQLTIANRLIEERKYRDVKTGLERSRTICTIAGSLSGGEIVSCQIYGDSPVDFESLPHSGQVVLDVYKYEATNALMGTMIARGYKLVSASSTSSAMRKA